MKRIFLCLGLSACSLIGSDGPAPLSQWGIHGSVRPAGSGTTSCATIEPWVIKSGAEGVAFILEARGRAACAFAPAVVEMQLPDQVLHRELAVPPAKMTDGAVVRFYAPLPFDNRAAWNRGSRKATLFVRGTIDGQPFESGPWTLDHLVVRP
jgi:hypothetical protein